MPPKQASSRARGQTKSGSKRKRSSASAAPARSSSPLESSDDQAEARAVSEAESEGAEQNEARKSIPDDLLTRMLHELFAKEATRISRDANAAVGKYVDVFVREAMARAAVDKKSGFLEVEDLEKIAPQLLLDL